MVERQQREEHGADQQGEGPREGDVVVPQFDESGDSHQYAIAEDIRQAVERAAYAHECRLVALAQGKHVEAVGGNVVCGRGKGGYREEQQRDVEQADGRLTGGNHLRRGVGDGECQPDEAERHEHLHGDGPPPLGAQDVDEGAPERLDGPRQIEQAGEERHFAIGHTELGKHQDGDVVDDEVGQAFGEVEGGDPQPGGDMLRLLQHGIYYLSIYYLLFKCAWRSDAGAVISATKLCFLFDKAILSARLSYGFCIGKHGYG